MTDKIISAKNVELKFGKGSEEVVALKNISLEVGAGEFVSFIDADDWWLKDKIKSQIDFFQKNVDVNIIYSNLYIFYEKKIKKVYSQIDYTMEILHNYF